MADYLNSKAVAALTGLKKSQANTYINDLVTTLGLKRHRIPGRRGLFLPAEATRLLNQWVAEAQDVGITDAQLTSWLRERIRTYAAYRSLPAPSSAETSLIAELTAQLALQAQELAALKAEVQELKRALPAPRVHLKRGRR